MAGLILLASVCQGNALSAQPTVWQPSGGHTQVQIWPGAIPDPVLVAGPEVMTIDKEELVAGRPYGWVVNVSQPTMTVYPP